MKRPSPRLPPAERERLEILAAESRQRCEDIELGRQLLALLMSRKNGTGFKRTVRELRFEVPILGDLWLRQARQLREAFELALETIRQQDIAVLCNGRGTEAVN